MVEELATLGVDVMLRGLPMLRRPSRLATTMNEPREELSKIASFICQTKDDV
jgi:hypothetical protein